MTTEAFLPIYDLYEPINKATRRLMGEAQGIEAAERAVEQWIEEGEGIEFHIYLGDRHVETGRRPLDHDDPIEWTTYGRRRDLQ